jgi:GntR family transcriptional regulator
VVLIKRLRIVDDRPVAIHTSYLPASLAHILDSDLTGSLTNAMKTLGTAVADAIEYVESVVASEDEAAILGIQPGEPLLRIEGTAYSGSGQPLRYTDALYRGDIFRFSVDTTKPSDLRVVVRSQETTDQPTDTNTGDKP